MMITKEDNCDDHDVYSMMMMMVVTMFMMMVILYSKKGWFWKELDRSTSSSQRQRLNLAA